MVGDGLDAPGAQALQQGLVLAGGLEGLPGMINRRLRANHQDQYKQDAVKRRNPGARPGSRLPDQAKGSQADNPPNGHQHPVPANDRPAQLEPVQQIENMPVSEESQQAASVGACKPESNVYVRSSRRADTPQGPGV